MLIPKSERRFSGFDNKILAIYPRDMTGREIQVFLAEQKRHWGHNFLCMSSFCEGSS